MSQTPPPSDDRPENSTSPGVVRSILVRILRGTSSVLDGWADRLEAETTAAARSPLASPFVWISAIAAVVVLAIVAVPLFSTPSQPTPPPEVAVREPEPTPPPEIAVREPERLGEPVEEVPPAAVTELEPEAEPEPELEPEAEPEPLPELEPEAEPGIPSDLSSPDLAKPLELARPPLTPEQRLVAAVRQQIVQVAKPYEDNEFVTGVSANFEADLLRVKLTSEWYDLEPPAQDDLANELWSKAQSLDFTNVEIADDRGTLLARNPVVGDRAIVIQRTREGMM
ncbi:hypothetical protein [Baaleninema sp.]|uniref:hypothetical protein n=1 Tax=Baaleninema sp. TaxID=3101197 RepID=UPI003CFF8000